MSNEPQRLVDRALGLRNDFDRSFAEPPHFDTTPKDDFLSIRLGSEAFALRLSEIAGLYTDKRITGLPSRVPTLMGIAGFRGAILPVYNLHTLLGFPLNETPKWVVVAAAAPVALAFEAFDGHIRCSRKTILPYQPQESRDLASGNVREFITANDQICPIVHLPSILDTIGRQVPAANPTTGVPNNV